MIAAPRGLYAGLLDAYGRPLVVSEPEQTDLAALRHRIAKRRELNAGYDAASNSTEFQNHWANADRFDADSANSRIVRQTIVARSRYEIANNGFIDGMVQTLATDIVGTGPQLKLKTGNKEFNRVVEKAFKNWARAVRLRAKLPESHDRTERLSEARITKIISEIGEAAGVKVKTDPTTGEIKFASAHDLRRSFGARWASRVMPQVLQELMRHESIETTMKYYVGRNAQATADVLWQAHRAASNTSSNSGQNQVSTNENRTAVSDSPASF